MSAAPTDAGGDAPAICTEVEPASSDSEAIRILAGTRPSGAFSAYGAASTAASTELVRERSELAENPPTLEAPSGISAATEASSESASESSAVSSSAPGIDETEGAGGPLEISVCEPEPELAPIVDAPSGTTAISRAPEDPVARARYLEGLLTAAPVSDEAVDTDPGPPPVVALTEDADPGRLGTLETDQRATLDLQFDAARADMCVDEGVDAIYPTLPDEMLTARFDPGSSSLGEAGEFDHPALSGEMEDAIDRGGAGGWNGQVAGLDARYETGAETRRRDETTARGRADREIALLCDETITDQRDYRVAAGEGVDAARESWRGELDAAQGVYDTERGRIRTDMVSGIERERVSAETAASAHLAEGHRRAEAERIATERRAAEERAAAQREADESDGFFDWVASKVSSFFDKLRSLLHDLFDALRGLVRTIINGAKWLANQAIELGRRAIVGLIHIAGGLLEKACDVFLAAFPEARDRAKAAIRTAVSEAETGVNNAARWLREQTNRVLDALGNALIAILDAYEAIYAFILNVVRFLVIGLVEVYRFMARLTIAAYHSPDELEGQVYEELLGSDLTQPLPFELTEAEAARLAAGEGSSPAATAPEAVPGSLGDLGGGDAARVLTAPRLGDGDIIMDEVLPFDADPALLESLSLGDGESVGFGESNDPEASVDALRADLLGGEIGAPGPSDFATTSTEGAAPAGAAPLSTEEQLQALMNQDSECTCDAEAPTSETGPPIPLEAKIGPLTKGQRARYMMSQMWKGVRRWFSCNWGKILAAVIVALLVVAAIVAATILSGGTVAGLLAGAAAVAAPLMEVIAGAFILYAVARALSYIGDYLRHAWDNRIVDSSKSLARAVAVGLVELIFAIITYVTAGAFRVLAAAAKGTARAASTAVRGAAKLGGRAVRAAGEGLEGAARLGGRALRAGERTFVRLTGRTGRVMLVQGKLVLRNLRRGFARGVRSLRELGERLLARLRFRRFRLRREGRWFILEGYINPWVRIAQSPAELEWVDDAAVGTNHSRPGSPAAVGDTISGTTREGRAVTGEVISNASKGPYRAEAAHFMGSVEGDVVHHAMEQQVLNIAGDVVTRGEMHSIRNLRRIFGGVFNSRVHLSRIRRLWDEFYQVLRAVPRTPATAGLRRQALLGYRRYVDDMLRTMTRFQARSPAYRAAIAAGNQAEAARLLESAMDIWQTANPPGAVITRLLP